MTVVWKKNWSGRIILRKLSACTSLPNISGLFKIVHSFMSEFAKTPLVKFKTCLILESYRWTRYFSLINF